MKQWTPKEIMVMALIGVIGIYLLLLFFGWINNHPLNDSAGVKEIFIFILGIISAYIAGKTNKES